MAADNISQTDLAIVRGDTFLRRLTVTDLAGNPVDMSAWTFLGAIRSDPDDSATLAEISFDTTAAADGIVDASVAAEDTATFTAPFVFYHCRATTDASQVVTLAIGRLVIVKDSARAP